MGELIPGKFGVGKHGEMVYVDENGEAHHHGIDGVIHAIENHLKRMVYSVKTILCSGIRP